MKQNAQLNTRLHIQEISTQQGSIKTYYIHLGKFNKFHQTSITIVWVSKEKKKKIKEFFPEFLYN